MSGCGGRRLIGSLHNRFSVEGVMQPMVTIIIAKNGYFVRYVTQKPNTFVDQSSVVGRVDDTRVMVPFMKEESFIVSNEHELVEFLRSLRDEYYQK